MEKNWINWENYSFSQIKQLELELVWNYGREKSYAVVSFEGSGNSMTAFVLQDTSTARLYSFVR